MNTSRYYLQQAGKVPPVPCPPSCCPSTGELISNPGFEGAFSAQGVPQGWQGTNVEQENVQEKIHSGLKAVVLGANPSNDATLSQEITDENLIIPECNYHFSFFAGGSLGNGSTFTGSVVFLDSGGNEIARTDITIIDQSITAGVGKYYYVITPTAPANLATIRVEFVKDGVGQIDLDDVSLSIA
ncbi:MAG: hypothetical protein ACOYEO_06360 [bacterium]